MKLNKKSLIAKYVKWFTLNDDLPNNLCAFFWTAFSAIILSPFMLLFWISELSISKIFSENIRTWEKRISAFLLFYFIFIPALSFIVNSFIYHTILASSIIGGLIVVILVGIKWYNYSVDKKRKRQEEMYNNEEYYEYGYKEPKKYILFEFIKAKKQKYCPMIEWVDENK